MSDLNGETRYRLTVVIEEFDVVDGAEKPPEAVSSVEVKDAVFTHFNDVKAAQVKLSGQTMEEIPDYEE